MDKKEKINFAFWGTPDVASETLEILKQNGYTPSLIITSPDKPSGRGLKIEQSPVALFAEKNNIPCLKPEKLDAKFTLKLSTFNFQLSLVVAYGKIIPEDILKYPKLGSINIHYSLLPKYRGASPVESAILAGDQITGVSIQHMEFKMDAGDIIARAEVPIGSTEKAVDLRARLIKIGGELLVKILPEIMAGTITRVAQDESNATHCKKIKKEDGLIDLSAQANMNYNKFRAYATWPRSFFFIDGKRIIITDAKLEHDEFVIEKVLPEGKKEISYEDFLKH